MTNEEKLIEQGWEFELVSIGEEIIKLWIPPPPDESKPTLTVPEDDLKYFKKQRNAKR